MILILILVRRAAVANDTVGGWLRAILPVCRDGRLRKHVVLFLARSAPESGFVEAQNFFLGDAFFLECGQLCLNISARPP